MPCQQHDEKRTKQIIRRRKRGYSVREIAAHFHISKERVSQLLEKYASTTAPGTLICKAELARLIGVSSTLLDTREREGVITPIRRDGRIYYDSRKAEKIKKLIVHPHEPAPTVEITCAYCGRKHIRKRSLVKRNRSGLFYCDKKCFGRHMGGQHGFGAHPEHATKCGKKRRVDWDKVCELKRSGMSGAAIAREMKISGTGVSYVLRRYWNDYLKKFVASEQPKASTLLTNSD